MSLVLNDKEEVAAILLAVTQFQESLKITRATIGELLKDEEIIDRTELVEELHNALQLENIIEKAVSKLELYLGDNKDHIYPEPDW